MVCDKRIKIATAYNLKKTLGIKKEEVTEILRCIEWGMIPDALNKADLAMGDVGVAYIKKKGVLLALMTDVTFYKQYAAMYVDVPSGIVPTLLYDVRDGEFYVGPLDVWLNLRESEVV